MKPHTDFATTAGRLTGQPTMMPLTAAPLHRLPAAEETTSERPWRLGQAAGARPGTNRTVSAHRDRTHLTWYPTRAPRGRLFATQTFFRARRPVTCPVKAVT